MDRNHSRCLFDSHPDVVIGPVPYITYLVQAEIRRHTFAGLTALMARQLRPPQQSPSLTHCSCNPRHVDGESSSSDVGTGVGTSVSGGRAVVGPPVGASVLGADVGGADVGCSGVSVGATVVGASVGSDVGGDGTSVGGVGVGASVGGLGGVGSVDTSGVGEGAPGIDGMLRQKAPAVLCTMGQRFAVRTPSARA